MKALALLGMAAAVHLPILPPQNWWPVFSPDGTKVAFTQIEQRTMTLDVVDLASHRATRIAANQGQLSPSWSSTGRLAFSLGGRIYTSDANGSHRAAVTSAGHAYAPAWRPHSADIAYLTTAGATNTDLWVGGTLWARSAIGNPAWSADGVALAFQRDDGIYVTTGPGTERRVAPAVNPHRPLWSPDGKTIAYVAAKTLWLVPADGSSAPRAFASVGMASSDPAWIPDGTGLAYVSGGAVWEKSLRGIATRVHGAADGGVSISTRDGAVAFAGPRPGCTDHTAILLASAGRVSTLAGSCDIRGTAGNDVIRARNGQRDVVWCGAGRDTVYADRSDVLHGCEIVHRP